MENSITKTGAMLLLIMALIGMTHQSKGQEIKKYNKAPQNDKFVGTYNFDDGKQSVVIKLIKKPDVYIEKLDIYLDMIEGTVEYKKNNEVIMQAGTEPQIINGGAPPSTPNSMIAVFSDKRSGQRGTVSIDLNPKDSTIVFKLKKVPRGVIIKDESVYDARPFTIPAEITLKRMKD